MHHLSLTNLLARTGLWDGICVYMCYCVNLPPSTALFHLSLSVSPRVWAVRVNWAALELIALALWAPYMLCELWLAARLRNLDDCAWVESCWLLLTHWFSIRNHNLSTVELTLSVLSGKKLCVVLSSFIHGISVGFQHEWLDCWNTLSLVLSLPDVVMPLDVYLMEDSFWWLQEVLLHLHGNISGQQAHEKAFL